MAVAFGVAAVYTFDLDKHGVAIVGDIAGGLPSFGLPDMRAKQYLELAGAAVGVVLIGFVEGLGAAKTYTARHHYWAGENPWVLSFFIVTHRLRTRRTTERSCAVRGG